MYDNPPVLVDPATAAKIEIYAGPKEYEPVLKNFIGEDNLPSNYGGNLAALSPEVHPYERYLSLQSSLRLVLSESASLDVPESPVRVRSHRNPAAPLATPNHKMTALPSSEAAVGLLERARTPPRIRSVDNRAAAATVRHHDQHQHEHDPSAETNEHSYLSYFGNILSGLFQFPSMDAASELDESEVEDEKRSDGGEEEDGEDDNGDDGKSCSTDSNLLFSDALEFFPEEELRRASAAARHPDRRSFKNWREELVFLSRIYSVDGSDAHDIYSREGGHMWAVVARPIQCLRSLFRFLLHKITLDNWLANTSTARLERCLLISTSVFFLGAVMAMVLSSIELFTTPWVSAVAQLQLWMGIFMLLISTFMIIFSSVGYLSIQMKNRPLLILFTSFLAVGTFILFVIFVVSLLYYCLPSYAAWEDRVISSAEDVNLMKQYNLSLAIAAILATVLGSVVLVWALALIKRYRQEVRTTIIFAYVTSLVIIL